jgi:hypothetical protein
MGIFSDLFGIPRLGGSPSSISYNSLFPTLPFLCPVPGKANLSYDHVNYTKFYQEYNYIEIIKLFDYYIIELYPPRKI